MIKKLAAVALCVATLCPTAPVARAVPPKNVILCIGDGMGIEHVKAAGMYANGAAGTLCFEAFPYQAEMTTRSADSPITDSAASATAMATGRKVNNNVLSMAFPANAQYAQGEEMLTLLEYFRAKGKSTGLVTTVYMTNGTPAAFAAHEPNRKNMSQVAADYFTQARPNVLFGGGKHMQGAADAGYTVVKTRAEMRALDTDVETMVSGQFDDANLPYEYDGDFSTLPHLWEMTETALDLLDDDPDGFFLMVEGGTLDWAAHDNLIGRTIGETVGFARAVQTIVDWAQGRGDTLVLVTADHECGGLKILQDNGKGKLPSISWSSDEHTAANVGLYAWGLNAEAVRGVMDNTDVFRVAMGSAPAKRRIPPDLARVKLALAATAVALVIMGTVIAIRRKLAVRREV